MPTEDKGGVVLAFCRSLGKSLSVTMMASVLLSATAATQDAGRWTAGAAMPSERSEVAVAEVGGKIYVLGGYRGELELEIYDPVAGTLEPGCADPPRGASRGRRGPRTARSI